MLLQMDPEKEKPAMSAMVLLNLLTISQLLRFVITINVTLLPCDSDVNSTVVDCSNRPLSAVPRIISTNVISINISETGIQQLRPQDFFDVPNLHTLDMTGNCPLPYWRSIKYAFCVVKIPKSALKSLQNLKYLYLSGNSLTSIPQLPRSLIVLDLKNNQIFNISKPFNTPHLQKLFLTRNCFYANPCNHSATISEEVFDQLPQLKTLNLGYNNLTAVPKGLPVSLESLDLRENTITEILERAFAHLTSLKYLNLAWNCQRCDHAARPCFPCPQNKSLQLNPLSFYSKNSSITYLSLRGNSLKTIPEGLFRTLKNLKELDLSDNFLSYPIRNGTFFTDLIHLTSVNFIYNNEPLQTFSNMTLSPYITSMSNLQELKLSGNFFHTIPSETLDLLSKLKHLKRLELRMNFMESLDLEAFGRIPSLVFVDLSQNMLSFTQCWIYPSSECLSEQGCQSQSLYKYAYHEPSQTLVDQDISFGSDMRESNQLNMLEMLDENDFRFKKLWDFSIESCHNRLTFDLSQNNIMYLNDSLFIGMENAACLDLSLNYINLPLKGNQFARLKNLVVLNLSYNRLDLYYKDAFSDLKNTLRVLDISNNQFHFKMKGMGHHFAFLSNLINLQVLSLADNDIGIRIDDGLNSNSLKYLYFSGNELAIMWHPDNSRYTSFFQNLTSLIHLDISNNKLKFISSEVLCNLPRSIHSLNISNNKLSHFPWQNISALSNLMHLDLSQNHMKYLTQKGVQFPDNFSFLDLSHNRLKVIPQGFFSKAKSLQYLYLSYNQIKEFSIHFLPTPFKNGSALKQLTLHANPFRCDCETSWFADYLLTTPIKIPYLTTFVHCAYPESQQGKSVWSIDQRSCQDIYGSLPFFVCSFIVVIFTLLPLLKHLYGWDLWYCLHVFWAGIKGYSQLPGSDSLYHHDAFVVFDTSNLAVRDWVYKELLFHLENGGPRRFCLCLEERDWIPGLSCIDNLHNAVYNSVKTVFVLSSSVTNGETVNGITRQAFFMVQQRLLDEKVDVAVLVLLDEMFPKLKYLQLRKRLCRKSVLSWPRNPCAQPIFWNQLRMALASDNRKFYDNNMSESFY
ncbi:toll-like receptor 9 [Dunckerocampus dactyliophorus]|uniref:toll-like receptor 9 n=1 Tax=Dunckerocampus dactyliophorus TaxID=161453 RepID=UPI002406D237|nr:toll-like receptor 9 [Dunckerocampus dactyliophorus]